MTARRPRTAASLTACTLVTLVLAGCGHSVDTAKQTFPRRTVPAADVTGTTGAPTTGPSSGDSTPIDPAYAADRLRLVYPCALVDTQTAMGAYGTPEQPELQDYSECFFTVDGDDKAPRAYVRLDEEASISSRDKTQTVAGLTTEVDDTVGDGTCFVRGVIAHNTDRVIELQVHWDGGDPCSLGTKLLTMVVSKIKDPSARYQLSPGNLINVDACSALTSAEAGKPLGGTAKPDGHAGLHDCTWTSDSGQGEVRVHYRLGPDPAKQMLDTEKPVSVSGVAGVQEKQSSGEGCTITWQHQSARGVNKDVGQDYYELAEVDLSGAGGSDPCGAALTVAQAVQAKLPKA